MKRITIHHILNGKGVVTKVDASATEAKRILESLARLRANDGTVVGPNFAIPARSVELIKTQEIT